MPRPFKSVQHAQPRRSVFNLGYSKTFTCDMGQLIPIMCDEVVPGDKFKIGNEIVIRMQPLVAPILHEINCYVHYFFVPYRILWTLWEKYISGDVLGNNADTCPTWNPTLNTEGSLWDFLGFPSAIVPTERLPSDFPRRAYVAIWNNYYRDETLQTEKDITVEANNTILIRDWEKDYFTSALPWQQRGTAPALPISGTSKAEWPAATGANSVNVRMDSVAKKPYSTDDHDMLENNTVNLGLATTFNVSDLRLAFQIQKWMERNARSGVRYTEFLHSHFGVSPRDDRLQRPEYIGGSKAPVIVSEVLQTSKTDTSPQGNMAGHGISATQGYCGEYFAQEFGLIMGIMSIMPKPMYQQGINRQWLRQSRYDYYFPEFANLSEQAVERVELYASGVGSENKTIFGYQGRYDEMRYKPNTVHGQMRTTFAYWHLGRTFGSAPSLNETFLQCVPRKDIFAAPSAPGFIVSFGNLIKAIRPIPISAEPGLIDHG